MTVSSVVESPALPLVDHPLLSDLTGRRVSYAWEMVDQRGFADAFQMRFMAQGQPDLIRQFEVVGSEICIYHVEDEDE